MTDTNESTITSPVVVEITTICGNTFDITIFGHTYH